jgi:hypothetical protein
MRRRGSRKKITEESQAECYYNRLLHKVIYVQRIVLNNSSLFRTAEEVCQEVLSAAL